MEQVIGDVEVEAQSVIAYRPPRKPQANRLGTVAMKRPWAVGEGESDIDRHDEHIRAVLVTVGNDGHAERVDDPFEVVGQRQVAVGDHRR